MNEYIIIGIRFFYIVVLLLVILLIANKNTRKKFSKILITIVCIWCIFFTIDFIRVKLQKSPIFCERYFSNKFLSYQDGDTNEYIGLGYKVIHFNTYRPNIGIIGYYYICPWETTYKNAFDKVIQMMK